MRAIAALLIVLQGGVASAQTSGSVSLVSEYRYRGESLSYGHPEPQASVAYDSEAGWYAGAFASKVDFPRNGVDTQANLYAGYALRLDSRMSWEAGISKSMFLQTSRLNYHEIYTGLAFDRISARIYYSPAYYGQESSTLYLELNGALPLAEHLNLIGHAGVLRTRSQEYPAGTSTDFRQDYRIGLSRSFSSWALQLEWVAVTGKRDYYALYNDSPSTAVVLAASYSF